MASETEEFQPEIETVNSDSSKLVEVTESSCIKELSPPTSELNSRERGELSIDSSLRRLPENGLNYSTKKTIAQGMMDIALLTANASQLKSHLATPYWDIYHKVNITLIAVSIILQLVVGVALIFIGRLECQKCREDDKEHNHYRTTATNDVVVALVFVITVVNIFVATFTDDDYNVHRSSYRSEL